MKLLLDTNGYRGFCDGESVVVDALQRAHLLLVPFVALAELRAGFLCGTRARKNESVLVRFLASSRVLVAYADEQTTHHFARVFAQLRKQGTPIPSNDIWIAALTVQHNATLCSRDKYFAHLPQLARLDDW